ncbi:MAG: hypothetical protein ACE5FT_03135 [Candidatus Nanoarchaeia archaeon]
MKIKRKQLMQVNGALFLIIAVLHIFRLLNDWNVIVADVTIPLWLSYVAVLVGGYLAYQNWNQAK